MANQRGRAGKHAVHGIGWHHHPFKQRTERGSENCSELDNTVFSVCLFVFSAAQNNESYLTFRVLWS